MNQQSSQQPRHEQYGQRGQLDQQPQQQQGPFDQQPQQQQGPFDQQSRQQYGQSDQQAPQQRGQYDQQPRQGGQAEPTWHPNRSGQSPPQTGMQSQHQQRGRDQGQEQRNRQPTGGQGTQSQGMQSQAAQPRGTQSRGAQPSLTHSFRDHLTDELRIALEDFNELAHVAAWCAKECSIAGIGTCARICQDLAEIAELNEMLIARDSMFGSEVAETFVRVGRDALTELRQYQRRHPHVVETVSTLERTMNACSTLLEMGDRGGQQSGSPHAGGQRSQWQEPGGQQLPRQSSGRARHPRF